MKAWTRLSRKDQLRWLLVVTALIVGLYGLLVYPSTVKELEFSEAMVLRRLDRMERRTGTEDLEVAANPAAVRAELRRVEEARTGLREALETLKARFADPDSEAAREDLLLALSSLAEASGLRVRRLGGQGAGDETRAAPRLTDPISGREFVRIEARGGFWDLMDFLDGLPALASVSAVIGLELTRQEPEEDRGNRDPAANPPGELNMTLEVSL